MYNMDWTYVYTVCTISVNMHFLCVFMGELIHVHMHLCMSERMHATGVNMQILIIPCVNM